MSLLRDSPGGGGHAARCLRGRPPGGSQTEPPAAQAPPAKVLVVALFADSDRQDALESAFCAHVWNRCRRRVLAVQLPGSGRLPRNAGDPPGRTRARSPGNGGNGPRGRFHREAIPEPGDGNGIGGTAKGRGGIGGGNRARGSLCFLQQRDVPGAVARSGVRRTTATTSPRRCRWLAWSRQPVAARNRREWFGFFAKRWRWRWRVRKHGFVVDDSRTEVSRRFDLFLQIGRHGVDSLLPPPTTTTTTRK
mmetsp:Transcript_30013/g.70750  ORF Transcript_30013/g.70750 Transcript_30013/m.70750 type:complete len:249 (-) Transcript_30013:2-748(-)